MDASIIIRTYNEARHLSQLLQKIAEQQIDISYEIIIVDSGSTDETLSIARKLKTQIINIDKNEFTFGRSINYGCNAASGKYLVFISGHCIPKNDTWLEQLVKPLKDKNIAYSYGRQVGNETSRFSERQIFKKYYPKSSAIPQDGFFCNNANAALKKEIWEQHPFNESLTGLEDMELGSRLINHQYQLAYVAEAPVYHLHNESWHQVRMRYQREAVALRQIMPEVFIRFSDFLRFYSSAVLIDTGAALKEKIFWGRVGEILTFRLMQYWGSYRGNNEIQKLSSQLREEYFYPK